MAAEMIEQSHRKSSSLLRRFFELTMQQIFFLFLLSLGYLP